MRTDTRTIERQCPYIFNAIGVAIGRRNFYNGGMRFFCAKFVLVLIPLIFFSACAEDETANQNANAANANSSNSTPVNIVAKDDIGELGKIITLPAAPEEATYYEFDSSGKKLVAVLLFNEANAAQIVAAAQKFKPFAPADIDPEVWFPPELIAKSQETGDTSLKGVEYAADDFLRTPYNKGRLVRINDTNYFVLELFSS